MPAETSHAAPIAAGEGGSIALLALWSVAIIGFLLAAATMTTRTELRAAGNAIAESRARLAAEAGTQLGLARLIRRRADGVQVFDGGPEAWRDGGIQVDVAIIDEAGKIDLNEAPFELLSGLLVALGRSRETALLLACNILDRRGAAGAPCPEPHEAADRARSRPQRFLVPEELAQVPGFDDSLYDEIADYVTVATRASAIDPLVAARPVLLAIPGATPTMVDAFVESRARWHDIAGPESGIGLTQALRFVTTSPAREFTISAVARGPGRARHRADLLVRLTETAPHPYEILGSRAPPVDRSRQASPPPHRVP
jgi:general secretion pathway protein K